jgi:acarbose 7IV-phosphotransferase
VPDLTACEEILAGARLVHLHLENWCRHLPAIARRHGVLVSADLQDLTSLDDPYRRDFIAESDVLFFSCVNFPQPEPVVTALLDGRRGRVVIGGRGGAGVVVGTADGIRFLPAVDLPEPVVDTNGAGDALAVGFLASWVLDGFDLETALLRGQLAARRTCAQRAGKKTLISRAELDELTVSCAR